MPKSFYFVTICTHQRHHYFGDIVEMPNAPDISHRMVLSEIGAIAQWVWTEIPHQFPLASLDEFVVMPNHVHGIIQLTGANDGAATGDAARRDAIHRVSMNRDPDAMNPDAMNPDAINRVSTGGVTGANNLMMNQNSISAIMRWYKGRVTFETRKIETSIPFAWQTRFHDHIIRTEYELNNIRCYIQNNPANWHQDDQNTPSGQYP